MVPSCVREAFSLSFVAASLLFLVVFCRGVIGYATTTQDRSVFFVIFSLVIVLKIIILLCGKFVCYNNLFCYYRTVGNYYRSLALFSMWPFIMLLVFIYLHCYHVGTS